MQKTEILKDLEEIYLQAMEKGNFSVALKAKELLGKELGLFGLSSANGSKRKISLADLSDDELSSLIEDIENQLALDRSKGER